MKGSRSVCLSSNEDCHSLFLFSYIVFCCQGFQQQQQKKLSIINNKIGKNFFSSVLCIWPGVVLYFSLQGTEHC